MSKIKEYFNKEKYSVVFGHEMPAGEYEYVEDYRDEVSQEFFVALFKLFVAEEKEIDFGYSSLFNDVEYSFDADFGCYDEDCDEIDELIEELDEKDIRLTQAEEKMLKKFFEKQIDDVVAIEEDAYDPDWEDSAIEDAIENKSFVIVISTQPLS